MYWENHARSRWAANAANMSEVPLRGIPMKKMGRSSSPFRGLIAPEVTFRLDHPG
jgi:hypothetical protein